MKDFIAIRAVRPDDPLLVTDGQWMSLLYARDSYTASCLHPLGLLACPPA